MAKVMIGSYLFCKVTVFHFLYYYGVSRSLSLAHLKGEKREGGNPMEEEYTHILSIIPLKEIFVSCSPLTYQNILLEIK